MEELKVIVQVFLFHSPEDIEHFLVNVTALKYKLVRSKLLSERQKLIVYLQGLQEEGKIKSVLRPKNKRIQKHLDEICNIKKIMKKSIEKLDVIFK